MAGAALLIAAPAFAQTDPKIESLLEALNRLKVTGYLHAQYVHDAERNQFSVRRGRIKFTYQATKTSKFVLEPDITGSGVTLKDGYVELTEPWTRWRHTLTAGQFKWPFGHELFFSSSRRELPERSRVVRTLFAGERDRGVMLSGRGLGEKLDYRVAVVNGSGTRSDDTNKRKDVVGRIGYAFGAVGIGASLYRGSELAPSGAETDKRRAGVDVQWKTPLPGFAVRGEYITGEQSDRDVDGWNVYAIQNIGKRHVFAVRVDEYDDGVEAERAAGAAYSFLWDAHSKVMIAYEVPDEGRNLFTLRYQFSF